MEKEPFAWVDAEDCKGGHGMDKSNEIEKRDGMDKSKEIENGRGIDKSNKLEDGDGMDESRELRMLRIGKRVKQHTTPPSDIGQENSTERDDRYHCIIKRLEGVESAIGNLTRKKRSTREETRSQREIVLNAWCKAPSPTGRGPNDTTYEGDIRADIRTITAKEKTDPETADRWKAVVLDRYGLHWGVDCGSQNELSNLPMEMVRLFNIRARVIYGWGNARAQILDICDDWIARWRCGVAPYIPSKEYRQLCRLYYS
ncbi:unnamed protein product [Penicillium egyptiacum]|uniref:Uncharacterized protein n=1 Tax=Penicillium egyptiacum TaxID=1303716 RepID=A0A9W4NZ27_9EURO|nr:unnamed protein product [Penicillium egyptiacum]